MRFNRHGEIARDFQGAAVAAWLTDSTELYQRPASPQWEMVTRTGGVVTPLGVGGGCNSLAAGNGTWMRRLDGAHPALSGSHPWQPATGRVGDVSPDGRVAVTLGDNYTHGQVYIDGQSSSTFERLSPFGGLRLSPCGRYATWVEFPGPTVRVYDIEAGALVYIHTVAGPQYTPLVFVSGGALWLAYQTDEGGVCHPASDVTHGYRWGITGAIYDPDVLLQGDGCVLGSSTDPGQFQQHEDVIVTLGANMQSLAPAPVVPERPFGPLSAALTDGTVINLADYIVGTADTWPRVGTHPMHQHGDSDRLVFVKFDDPHAYETWTVDRAAGWCHHIEDASDTHTNITYTWTDTRWIPLTMRIGEDHAFSTGPHVGIYRRRADCVETERRPWNRRTWLVSAWASFWCGADLGDRPVVCVAYDSTDGHYAHDRGVELYYFALGAGWLRWEYHRSDRVFAGARPVFNDATRVARSDFYRRGGRALAPALTGCEIAPSPTGPPVIVPPAPPVPPVPPGEPVTPQQIAEVLAGTYFEDISTLLMLPSTGVPGTEESRRPAIHTWAREWVEFLDSEYRRLFDRGLDLEAAGSRLLLAVRGKSRAWMTTMLEQAKDEGAK